MLDGGEIDQSATRDVQLEVGGGAAGVGVENNRAIGDRNARADAVRLRAVDVERAGAGFAEAGAGGVVEKRGDGACVAGGGVDQQVVVGLFRGRAGADGGVAR